MTSKALQSKIRQTRLNAPLEVPKARLCSRAVLAMMTGQPLDAPVQELRTALGSSWSSLRAIQFMSGRRGQMAAQAAPEAERNDLWLAQLLAKELADGQAITAINIAALEQVAKEIAMGGAQAPEVRDTP